ncbi:MAG: c-type cytochrome, partial [Syntrophothermus sp.]
MRKFFKVVGILFSAVIVLILIGVAYFNSTYPKVGPAPNVKFEHTKERIERGKYLANHVTGCIDCHSTRDWAAFTAPLVPGTEGKGGMRYDKMLGIPGTVYARNLTPANLGSWTDGEIMRAITSGVSKDGHVLFPLMPYQKFNSLSQEDLYSIIAYIRTLPAIKNDVPESSVDFPVSMMMKMAPQPYEPKKTPDPNNPKEWGKYLVTIGGCEDC